jgi:hypothetical protein
MMPKKKGPPKLFVPGAPKCINPALHYVEEFVDQYIPTPSLPEFTVSIFPSAISTDEIDSLILPPPAPM